MTRSSFDTLVCVPLHGICRAGFTGPDAARLDSSWVGIYPCEAPLLCEHVQRGVELAATLPTSVLVLSGGDTQPEPSGRSEADSALDLARDHDWFGHPAVADRTRCESDARDSGQNLSFSAFLFRRLTGSFPRRTIVVGWAFKATRFATHAHGLPFLEGGIEYVGVNNPPRESLGAALSGEADKLQAIVEARDWLLEAPRWQEQRDGRNPRRVPHPYDGEIAMYVTGNRR
jgi:hypothetical protein